MYFCKIGEHFLIGHIRIKIKILCIIFSSKIISKIQIKFCKWKQHFLTKMNFLLSLNDRNENWMKILQKQSHHTYSPSAAWHWTCECVQQRQKQGDYRREGHFLAEIARFSISIVCSLNAHFWLTQSCASVRLANALDNW